MVMNSLKHSVGSVSSKRTNHVVRLREGFFLWRILSVEHHDAPGDPLHVREGIEPNCIVSG